MLASDTATGRVLVVEDDAEIADVLRRTLRQEGHEVRSAADGVAALEVAEDFVPDLVILDLGCRSWTASRSAAGCARRATPDPHPHRPDPDRRPRRGARSGADDYLVKPFERKELLARLRP